MSPHFRRFRRSTRRSGRVRSAAVLLAGVVIAVAVAPLAIGATGSFVRAGLGNSATSETGIIANTTGYATRQSNLNTTQGGAVAYGCRAPVATKPCLFAFNLSSGQAFQFRSRGLQAGTITVNPPAGKTAAQVAPFTTNATGVATGLNADMVDGHHSTDFEPASGTKRLGAVKLTAGQTQLLTTVGDVTVYGQCAVDGAQLNAQLFFTSTAGGSVYHSGANTSTNLAAVTPGTLISEDTLPTTPAFNSTGNTTIVAPDGTLLTGSVFAGVGVAGGSCLVGGTLTVGNATS
jgi:hypothetical protein